MLVDPVKETKNVSHNPKKLTQLIVVERPVVEILYWVIKVLHIWMVKSDLGIVYSTTNNSCNFPYFKVNNVSANKYWQTT